LVGDDNTPNADNLSGGTISVGDSVAEKLE
jgi:hypothetical protein